MYVTPIKDRTNPTRSYVRIYDIPAIFPNDRNTPKPDEPVQVMITGIHYHTDESGAYDKARPKRIFIRVVTDKYVPVKYEGFHVEDNKPISNGEFAGLPLRLQPGRTGAAIDNKPGIAFVRMQDLNRNTVRIEGVEALESLECFKALVSV